jgi:hypothetical protein
MGSLFTSMFEGPAPHRSTFPSEPSPSTAMISTKERNHLIDGLSPIKEVPSEILSRTHKFSNTKIDSTRRNLLNSIEFILREEERVNLLEVDTTNAVADIEGIKEVVFQYLNSILDYREISNLTTGKSIEEALKRHFQEKECKSDFKCEIDLAKYIIKFSYEFKNTTIRFELDIEKTIKRLVTIYLLFRTVT